MGRFGTSGSDQSWTNTSSGSAGAYNAVLRNFAASASSGGSGADVSFATTALETATQEYNQAVSDNNAAQSALTTAQNNANFAASTLSQKLTDQADAQSAEISAHTVWQNAVGVTAQKLTAANSIQSLQYQTDKLIIPHIFTMVAAAIDSVTGDLTLSYVSQGDPGLAENQHSVKVVDHDVDPIDLIVLTRLVTGL